MAQVNVNLAFSADTGKAKTQIMELQSLLSKIAYTGATSGTNKLQTDLHAASEAAKELQFHLNNAFNVSTGNFDLSMLDRSLKTSGTNIQKLSMNLLNAGATGQQAFVKLAQSISLADQPMFRISNRMKEFAVTMKNTVKWQLSSSMLHGFMGAVQSAYGYAQDLNESLNNIRIVTGYNTDKMAQFAEQANKAAKALSTTTTNYTDASLIYFQQGLSDAEVQGRTDTTIKLANVTGQSVEETANQMTAIWNNFDNGSKSLEYYADVITALGAATASSSKEISEGLNKFSAIAESVGLSYEYASAALATVTATTRQSADVVGNSFKTLFARIQGLNLGETLDDGTTLNKYSEALFKVGINVKDQSGQLKDMNTILDEMGSKWNTLGKDQQVALAQTVGGVRQYTQLIALMDNWDYFQQNLGVATGAEGTLNKQAEIYAQSWEAAEKRVQAAAEGIFQSLLDDKFFISINNGFANLLGGLDAFIDGAGGVKTVLIGIASIISTVFSNKIPEAIDSARYNLTVLTKGSEEAYKTIQTKMVAASDEIFKQMDKTAQVEPGTTAKTAYGTQITYANELTIARGKLAAVSDKMSASEKQMADMQLAIIEQTQQEIIALKQKQELLQSNINNTFTNLENPNSFLNDDAYIQVEQRAESVSNALKKLFSEDTFQFNFSDIGINDLTNECQALADKINSEVINALKKFRDNGTTAIQTFDLSKIQIGNKTFSEQLNNLKNQLNALGADDSIESARAQLLAFINILPEGIRNSTNLSKAISSIKKSNTIDELKTSITNLDTELSKVEISAQKASAQIKGIKDPAAIKNLYQNILNLKEVTDETEKKTTVLQNLYQEFKPTHIVRMSEALGSLGGLLGNVTTGFMSLSSTIKALANPDLSGWEKFSAVLSSTATLIPTILSGLSNWAKLSAYSSQLVEKENIALAKKIALQTLSNADGINYYKGTIDKSKIFVKSLNDENKEKLASIIADYALKKSKGEVTEEVTKATVEKIAEMMASTGLKDAQLEGAAASILEAGSNQMLTKSLWDVIKAKAVLTGKVALIAAAIAAVVAVIWLAVKAYNADADAAKKAAEAAKQAQENFKETKEAYDNLISDIESIDQARKSLDEMTKGTDEWTNAMLELNAQVMELINLYPQLAAAVKSVDGVLTINKESQAYKDFISQQQQQVLFAQQSAYGAQMRSNEATNQSKYTDLGRNIYYTSEYQGESVTQTLSGSIIEKVIQGYLDKGPDIFSAEGLKEIGIYNEDMIPAIIDAKSSIMELAIAIQANTTANQLYAEQIAASYLQNNEQYKDSQYQDEINKAVANDMLAPGEGIGDSWSSKYIDENGIALNDKQVQQAYAELMGYQWVKNGWGTGTYLNQVGQNVEINDETARYALNQQKWLKENTSGVTQEVTDVFNSLPEEMRGLIQSAIDGTKLTDEQLAIEGDATEYLGEYAEQLISIFGERIIPIIQSAIDQTIQTQQNQNQFDLESWKANYAEKMDIIKDLETGDEISAEDYALLEEEYSQYFQVQADGTAILIAKAEELKATAQSIEIGELKNDIRTKQDTIYRMNEADIVTDTGRTLDFNAAHNAATQGTLYETWDEAYINAVSEALGHSYTTVQEANAAYNEYINSLNNSQQILASTATSIDDLNKLFSDGFIDIEEYTQAIDGTVIKEALEEGLDPDAVLTHAEAIQDSIKVLDEYKDKIGEAVDTAEEQEKIAKKISLAHKKMNKGLQDLADNWEDWSKALDPKKAGTSEYQEALEGIKETVSDILDVPIDSLSDDFITSADTAKLLERAINGDMAALDELRLSATEDILIKAGVDTTAANEAIIALQADMAAIPDLEIGATVDISQALPSLWQLYEQGKITADDLQAALNSIGWEPNITYKTMTVAQAKGFYQTAQLIGPDGSIQTIDLQNYANDDAIVQVPVLTSATYRGSGGSTATPPKPSGGGGGGGGSAPKHAEKKNDSDKERYHTLQNQLEDLQSEYDAISEAKDRAFGKDKLNNIDKEIQKTNELINKQKEYVDAISTNLPIDKVVMDAYYRDLIGGTIEYDERGNISNYDQIQDAMFAKYNQMTDIYTEDSEEWQVFEKKYEQLEKFIEQYEETYDLLRDEEETYQELLRQRMDLQLEKIQYAIELKLNIAEDGLAVLEYQMGKIEDNAFKAAEAIGLFSKKAELLYEQMAADREGLNDILGQQLSQAEIIQFYNGDMSVLEGKTFTEDQMDAIKEYRDNLLDLNEEFDDIRENIEKQVMEVFDAWNEKLEQGVDKLEHYGDVLESYKNIIDIVGKDTLGLSDTFMATLNQSSIDNAINKVTATKKSYEAMIDAQSQAEQALEEAKARNDEASIKIWEENLQSITEEAQSAREEMLSAWEDALDGIAEQFEATVERVVDIFNKEIYTLGGLEGLSEDFSRQQENADIMLDDYQKIYELSKLSRDINKSIDDTDSISGKQKLKKLLEQINKLQEDGVEMSQYDLEYMQKTYDLRMAEIELEEAQRAKNTVRLRKDNEGNWSYVYTQNMDAVDTAQQKYEDALYAMQDVSSNYIDEMSEKLISTSQEMEEALAAIRIQDYANIDDYYAEVQRVQKQYEDELAVQQKELQKAIDNNKILYDEDWTNYHNATGYKISDTQDFATTFRDTLLGSLMGSEEDTANFTDVISSAVNTLTQGLMQGAEVYYANLQNAMNAAGTSTDDFAKDFEEKIKEIEEKSEESTNKIKDLAKDMSSSLKDITDSVTTWQETYGEVMQQIINSNLDVINSFNEMLKALSIDENSITVKYDILSDDTKKPEQYASGGYTGKWGNYGKLAILDEKELILNKDDTVNFLNALGIAKQIIDTIDLNALQASYGFGNLIPATINENNSQTIEQDVHITAEFPNATDHNEIEQAFETLINKASQYANRK